MSTPIDPVTRTMVQWAKRAARASGRDQMTIADILCGVYVLRQEERIHAPLRTAVAPSSGDIEWPREILDLHERARNIPETEDKFRFDHLLDAAVTRAYQEQPSLPPEALVPHLLNQPAPVVARLIEMNQGRQVPSALVKRLESALEASESLAGRLNQKVLGQEAAVRMLADAYFRAVLGAPSNGPRGVFTFLGPPGVGKTFLAENFALFLGEVEGKDYAWKRFDMSTMSAPQNFEQLFGTEQFYKGSRPGTLTGFVNENPRCVLLFDEIEKAHDLVIQSLLAVLDKGEVSDKALEKTVDFRKAWILFTTNLGREFFQESNESGVLQGLDMAPGAVFDLLASARRFRDSHQEGSESAPALAPEFVSRLAKGGAVVFRRLEVRHYLQLVDQGIRQAVESSRDESGASLPGITLTPDARLLFLASLMPDLDARRAASRSQSWALDLVKRSFEDCRTDLSRTNPHDWKIQVDAGQDSRAWLKSLADGVLLRVMVIDDDDFLPDILSQAGEPHSPEVRHVSSGDSVVAEIRRFQPGLVFLDLSIHEPDGSPRVERGLSILEQVRREFPELPVYLFSENPERRGDFDGTMRRVLRHGGARGFLAVGRRQTDSLHSDDLLARFGGILVEARHEAMLRSLRRGHKTLAFRPEFHWLAQEAVAKCELLEPRESVVFEAGDQVSPIRFSGVPRETFADVVGLERAKRRLSQVVGWLRDPSQLGMFGVMPPRGFLLSGPPGTGKTLLARALAGEAGLPFLSLSAGELKSKWVGESEERIRDLFRMAREYAPTIVFIDEIDGIARRRSPDEQTHTYSTLNQLLASMDGIGGRDRSIFVLAATNHADELDPAILRPGRFDEMIPVDLPDGEARTALFRLRLTSAGAGDIDTGRLVDGTVGCSPAELDRIVREAIYAASAAGRTRITTEDLENARRLVRFGAAREGFQVRDDERRVTAWHEAGHAMVHLALLPDRRIDHLTIVPSENGALGFLAPMADETRHDLTRSDVEAMIAVALAGREAERMCVGRPGGIGAGARSDLERATRLAWQSVTCWGFDDDFGPVALDALPNNLADAFSEKARVRVEAWLADGAARCRTALESRRNDLERLAQRLIERESLDWEGIREVTS